MHGLGNLLQEKTDAAAIALPDPRHVLLLKVLAQPDDMAMVADSTQVKSLSQGEIDHNLKEWEDIISGHAPERIGRSDENVEGICVSTRDEW